jgi:hypothetical protein
LLSNQNVLQSDSYRYKEQIMSHRGDTLPVDVPYTSVSVQHQTASEVSQIQSPTKQLFSPPKSKPVVMIGKDPLVLQSSIQASASTGDWKSLEETLNRYRVSTSEEIKSPYFNTSVNNQSDDRVGQAIRSANNAVLSESVDPNTVNRSGAHSFPTFGNNNPKKRENSPENSSALRVGPQLSFGLPIVNNLNLDDGETSRKEGETSRRSGNLSKETRGRSSIELVDFKEAREKSKSRDRSDNSRPLTPKELKKKMTIDPSTNQQHFVIFRHQGSWFRIKNNNNKWISKKWVKNIA